MWISHAIHVDVPWGSREPTQPQGIAAQNADARRLLQGESGMPLSPSNSGQARVAAFSRECPGRAGQAKTGSSEATS